MNEPNSANHEQQRPFDLEERLHTFYGPPLEEQQLPASSWEKLHLRLIMQSDTRRTQRRMVQNLLPRRKSRAEVPAFLLNRLAYVADKARLPYRPAILRCRFLARGQAPMVHSSWLGKPYIQLLLPMENVTTMGQAEQDVLLAIGLARASRTRKGKYMLGRLALTLMMIITGCTLVFSYIGHFLLIGLPIALMLCASVLWLWNILTRSIAFRADCLAVHWLGREQVCAILHT